MVDDDRLLVRPVGSRGPWVSPETSAYDDEAHLQALLVNDPGRIPGVSPAAMAVDELATRGGPVDICVVDADGSLTVVECKLASSSERRRMVVGQVIDYASAIWSEGEEAFHRAWQLRGGADLGEVLDAEAFGALRRNISEGRVNLCLAVDAIDDNLRRLIEFLNRVTLDHISVTALQLAYAKHGELEILIPSTFGGELAAAKTKGPRPRQWTRESFLEAMATDDDRRRAEQYFDLVEALPDRRGSVEPIVYGVAPGGSVFLHPYGLKYSPVQLWVNKAGRLMVYGGWRNYTAVAGTTASPHWPSTSAKTTRASR